MIDEITPHEALNNKENQFPNSFFSLADLLKSRSVEVPKYYFKKYAKILSGFSQHNQEYNQILMFAKQGVGRFDEFFTISNYPILVFSDDVYTEMLQRSGVSEYVLAFHSGNYIATSKSLLKEDRFFEHLFHEFIHALQFYKDLEQDEFSLNFEDVDLEEKLVKNIKIELEAYLSSFEFYKNELCKIVDGDEENSLIYHIKRLTNLTKKEADQLTETQKKLLINLMQKIQRKLKKLTAEELGDFLNLFEDVKTLEELENKLV